MTQPGFYGADSLTSFSAGRAWQDQCAELVRIGSMGLFGIWGTLNVGFSSPFTSLLVGFSIGKGRDLGYPGFLPAPS